MGAIQQLGAEAWRDFEVDGIPGSGPHQPVKSDMRAFSTAVDAGLAALATAIGVAGGAVVAGTYNALMDNNITQAAGTLGIVYADDVSKNGFYVKGGGPGVAGWNYTGAGPAGPPGPTGGNGGLIKATGGPAQLAAGLRYGFCSSYGGMSAFLPNIALVPDAEIIEITDLDYNAAANTLTVNSYAETANIVFEDQAATFQLVLKTNGGRLTFRKNNTANGIYWRASFNVA